MCYRLPHRRSAPESCLQSTARHPPRPPNSCFPARRARGIRSKLGATNSIEQYHLVLSRPRCCKPIELRPRSHHWPRVDSRGWLLSQGHDDDMSTQPCSYRWVRSAGGAHQRGRVGHRPGKVGRRRSGPHPHLQRLAPCIQECSEAACHLRVTLCRLNGLSRAATTARPRAGGTWPWRARVNGCGEKGALVSSSIGRPRRASPRG